MLWADWQPVAAEAAGAPPRVGTPARPWEAVEAQPVVLSAKPSDEPTLEAVAPEKAGNPDAWTEYDHETYRLHLAHLEKEGSGAGSFSSAVRRTASGRPSPLSSAGTRRRRSS